MSLKEKVRSFILKKDGEKYVASKKHLIICFAVLVGIGTIALVVFKPKEDSSVVIESTQPIQADDKMPLMEQKNEESEKVNSLLESSAAISSKTAKKIVNPEARYVKNIEYKAQQVIQRKSDDGMNSGVPIGTNLIGKLLTAIDTREAKQLYQVLLPYGGKDKNGGIVPKNTILFGAISYPNKGKKVFIEFSKALLPNGKEVILKAQALNSKDYSPGLTGEFHGKATERIVATLGLTMVSAMAETLTEKEALGSGDVTMTPTPKATAKNAFYQGVSKVSEMESSRQASEIANDPEYVTIPAGKEMIVNLVSTYYEEQ